MTVFPLRRVAPGVRYDFALPERGCFGDRSLMSESPSALGTGVAPWRIYGNDPPPREGLTRGTYTVMFSPRGAVPES